MKSVYSRQKSNYRKNKLHAVCIVVLGLHFSHPKSKKMTRKSSAFLGLNDDMLLIVKKAMIEVY